MEITLKAKTIQELADLIALISNQQMVLEREKDNYVIVDGRHNSGLPNPIFLSKE